jgi:hypothetical protein
MQLSEWGEPGEQKADGNPKEEREEVNQEPRKRWQDNQKA